MTTRRDRTQHRQFVTLVAAAVLEGIYLVALLARNASAFRDVRTHWARDLARESGMVGVVWMVLAAGVAALIVTLLARSRSISLVLALSVLVGCLGLESLAIVERVKFQRMVKTMTNLRDVGLKILKETTSSTSGFPMQPSPELAAAPIFRDGWGHPLSYVWSSPSHAHLVAPGSDGRIDTYAETIKSEQFPPSKFDHDIVVEFSEGAFSFIVHPDGPAQGIPCTIYSAFGCFSYWR